ncbi:MAG: biotin/lipoyl-binding protein [Ignavibacteria bacterium]|nr:biotin/lipoyl-binding protein [Ignavibacteria bacterium]
MSNIQNKTAPIVPAQVPSAEALAMLQPANGNAHNGYVQVQNILSDGHVEIITEIHSLERARTPFWLGTTSLAIVGILGVLVLFLVFVPWQQNITGSGKVTSFVPGVRPQTIDAQITGRIVRWFVNEGMAVKAGDTIAILQDLNVNFMDADFMEKIERVREKTVGAQNMAVETARQRTIQAEQRELAAKAALENTKIEIQTSRIRYKRAEELTKEGLASQREMETALLNLQKTQADSIRSETFLESARRDVEAAKNEESRVLQQADATIAEIELRVANARQRGGASVITAPVDGYLVRIAEVGAGQTVKDGEMLAMLVPTAGGLDQAVEAFISSRDAAIVDVGRPVRLQFSGFPAFVFNPGWDNFTINTFGGRVAVVDAVDDGSGYYRVLIVPDSTQKQGKWPSSQYLRQGTPTNSWILLNEVPIGFEIWRQLNGFPPVLPHKMNASDKADKDGKKK